VSLLRCAVKLPYSECREQLFVFVQDMLLYRLKRSLFRPDALLVELNCNGTDAVLPPVSMHWHPDLCMALATLLADE
jgi:hypothetical protein